MGNFESLIAPLRQSLTLDGYDLVLEREAGCTLVFRIIARPGACPDCLVPKPIMRQILAQRLGSSGKDVNVELLYPDDMA